MKIFKSNYHKTRALFFFFLMNLLVRDRFNFKYLKEFFIQKLFMK